MSSKNKNFIVSTFLIILSIIFTILVKVVDVKPVGVNGSSIGFGTINDFVFKSIGTNMLWYKITECLGIISISMAICYALIGCIQLIKRKNIFKVDKEILVLGIFYAVVISLYLFFEKVIINYRPILIENVLEASYPSSHTLMTLCICGSSIIINKILFNNKFTKYLNILSLIIMSLMIIGRLLSGVHWFTDIIGGMIISSALLMTLYLVINIIQNKKN